MKADRIYHRERPLPTIYGLRIKKSEEEQVNGKKV
jgi:hypothetical protein